MVGFLLISVGVYGRAASIVTNLPIVGGILACGIILILISILGIIGASKHHQVLLFFVSFLSFIKSLSLCGTVACQYFSLTFNTFSVHDHFILPFLNSILNCLLMPSC